jgi:hypothetical protein
MSSDPRSEFFKLNEEYQKCLNQYYDKFLDGHDVEINDNICLEILEKMKQKGDFYKNMKKEYDQHITEEMKKKKNI